MKMNPGGVQQNPQDLQSAERRRALRRAFRRLNEEISENASRLVQPGNEGLIQHVDTLNQEVASIDHPRELAIDTGMMRRVAEMAQQQAEGIRIDSFDMEDYAKKLASSMRTRQTLDWSGLGSTVLNTFRRSPDLEFMYGGALDIVPRVRAARKLPRQPHPSASETTRPTEVQQSGDSEEATTRDVHNLLVHLRRATEGSPTKRVHYFKFLLHPTSFSQTVENVFHLSFLVKDGRVALTTAGGQPYICLPTAVASSGQAASVTGGVRQQAILSIDMALWQELVVCYQVKQPMIKPIKH